MQSFPWSVFFARFNWPDRHRPWTYFVEAQCPRYKAASMQKRVQCFFFLWILIARYFPDICSVFGFHSAHKIPQVLPDVACVLSSVRRIDCWVSSGWPWGENTQGFEAILDKDDRIYTISAETVSWRWQWVFGSWSLDFWCFTASHES